MVKKMNETPNLELFYDVLDESINKLYEVKKQSFFKLLIETGRNIIAQDVLNKEATPEQKNELMEIYHKLDDVDFNVEEIRKAFQLMVLRAFNESNLKNGDTTPDTLGIFISYLINKLKGKVKKLNVLDPVVGSGNLLYSVANHLDCDLHLFGIDNVRELCDIASIQGDLLNYDIEIFCQDTLDHPFSDIDIVVADIPNHTVKAFDKEYYFPYMCVLQHMASLQEDGYFIGIVPNDFFEHDENGFFKENIINHGSVLGVLELPVNMFKANPKSIVIFTRKPLESKKCLLVELPSFSDPGLLNKALIQIEDWFLINKKEVK
jgi:site-specific DNA-methyltransferase (adenine-specific)